ncbi:MAG: hypothetical protein J6L59_01975 [Clostridia bacterium]|nr:hypothetical protein [Clostridia bacterium]
MKKILYLTVATLFIIFMVCGCGKSYTCHDCGESTSKAYYDMNAKIDKVMCEDCAREYWMPMPYQNYQVK